MSEGTYRVRTYEAKDLERCRQLWVELTQWHRDIYDCQTIGGEQPGLQFDDHLARVGEDCIWLVQEDTQDGLIVGLAGLIVHSEKEGELEPVVVLPAYRGSRIGEMLVRAVQDSARKRGLGELKVRPVARNLEAIRFFHTMGFDGMGHVDLFMSLGKNASFEGEDVPSQTFADRTFKI